MNGKQRELPAGALVDALVVELLDGAPPRGVAVALNGEVLPRTDWPGTTLSDGDNIEVLTATQGG